MAGVVVLLSLAVGYSDQFLLAFRRRHIVADELSA